MASFIKYRLRYPIWILAIVLNTMAQAYHYHHHHQRPLHSEPRRYSAVYTIRTGRAASDTAKVNNNNNNNIVINQNYNNNNNPSNNFQETSRYAQEAQQSSKSFYSTPAAGSSSSGSVLTVASKPAKMVAHSNYGSSSATSGSTGVSTDTGISSLLSASASTVIKHPSTCSYDRSQTACTFSLLCYLANGIPIEGCEENPSLTCCYIQLKSISNVLAASQTENGPTGLIFRPYRSTTESPIGPMITAAVATHPTTVSIHSGYHSAPTNIIAAPSSYSNVKYSNSGLGSTAVAPADTKAVAPLEKTPNYIETPFSLKNELLTPYESKSQTSRINSHEYDYVSNAVRRTRPENMKSVFQEIVNRKFYARNYDIEDICGKPMAKPRSRIIGGQDAYFGEFPWQVHIKITKHQCGGALINSMFIVTAAHCIYQAPIHQLNVIIGAHDIEDHRYQDIPPQYFSVSRVILHPNFRFSASHPDRYDIALIKLDNPVRFSDSVLPVCLPEETLHLEGRKGVVTGWGKTDPALSNRYGTRLLQKVDVPIIDNEKCETWHRTRGIDLRIFSEMMCAGYEDGQKDACVGDSGGPLVININGRWTLAGITSAGFGCAQSRQPGIYHRVSNTVEWIRQTLRDEEETNLVS